MRNLHRLALSTALVVATTIAANAGGPISPAYAPTNSPALTGTPTAPTATTADNSTTLATTALASAKVAAEAARATSAESAIGGRIPSASTSATPTLLLGGSAPSAVTYSKQALSYVQIGPLVEFTLDLEWSALTSSSGAVTVAGLPSGATLSPEMAVYGFGVTPSSAPYAVVNANGSISVQLSNGSTPPASDASLTGSTLASAGGLLISGFYFVN